MLLNVFNLSLLLLCCRIETECCTKKTFENTTIQASIATRSHHSLLRFKTAITGCITPEIISHQLGQVTVIQIYCINGNIPRLYENAISNLSELTTLIFRYSKIKRINNKAFFNLPKLATLDLGGNEIAAIDENALQNLDLLEYIHLQGNKIVFLEHGIFANLPNLHTLTLARNELEAFEQEWFGQSFELHSVNISNNFIRTIQKQTFKPFKSLLNIDLGSNHIHYIHKKAFDGLQNLSSLLLHGNRIQKLHRDVFRPLKQLSILWLHRNNLTYISDKTLKGLANNRLKSMSIHSNPWQCGCYDNILKWAQEISVYINTVAECYNEENAVCVIPAENEDMCLEEREEDLNSLFYKSFNHTCVLKVDPGNPEEGEHPCLKYIDECGTMLCEYGTEAYVDEATLCTSCRCYNPCRNTVCDQDFRCAVDVNRNRTTNEDRAFIAVCRPSTSVTSGGEGPDTGDWAEWSEPSPCSRTCGGGVSTQQRECHDTRYPCQGPTKRHFSCNIQDCPDIGDYRSQQCSEFDRIPFEGSYYQWIPYTKASNSCELNCMPRGERFYNRHKQHVVDGTTCNDEKLDVCVEGTCQPVGCDMMLGSNATEDRCRHCGGDGSMCNTISGVLDMQDLKVGYNDILLIPAGATNVNVREAAPSNNYLAVRNTTGHYYLNGNWQIDVPRSLDVAGCKFHYDRYPKGFSAAADSITCLGPTDEALFIVLLYQDVNVGVHYEYSIPNNV